MKTSDFYYDLPKELIAQGEIIQVVPAQKFRAPAPAEKWKVFLYRRGFDMAVCEAAAAAFRAEAPENAEEDDGFDE